MKSLIIVYQDEKLVRLCGPQQNIKYRKYTAYIEIFKNEVYIEILKIRIFVDLFPKC